MLVAMKGYRQGILRRAFISLVAGIFFLTQLETGFAFSQGSLPFSPSEQKEKSDQSATRPYKDAKKILEHEKALGQKLNKLENLRNKFSSKNAAKIKRLHQAHHATPDPFRELREVMNRIRTAKKQEQFMMEQDKAEAQEITTRIASRGYYYVLFDEKIDDDPRMTLPKSKIAKQDFSKVVNGLYEDKNIVEQYEAGWRRTSYFGGVPALDLNQIVETKKGSVTVVNQMGIDGDIMKYVGLDEYGDAVKPYGPLAKSYYQTTAGYGEWKCNECKVYGRHILRCQWAGERGCYSCCRGLGNC